MSLEIKKFLDTLEDRNINLFCCGPVTRYHVEVSYKSNDEEFLYKDSQLRLLGSSYNGVETASDYVDNERYINFSFESLQDLKDFISEVLFNNYLINFITKGKKVIWRSFIKD